jgi:hypothetical protein
LRIRHSGVDYAMSLPCPLVTVSLDGNQEEHMMLATGIIAHITALGGQIRGIHPQKNHPE